MCCFLVNQAMTFHLPVAAASSEFDLFYPHFFLLKSTFLGYISGFYTRYHIIQIAALCHTT